ncbi:uncharacterized protein LOC113759912 [Coffea eugenioides]|uniref:uncharacterized protein LOC113759912 n=1 Tax=Coffea eugenioides TaxID=49369 RepID=UPI000F5D2CB0|nr:uncharacterized protein LOC113729190 [Coffea arabica]XP_027158291.1 uncharacterized protein LOC113759912 [Coffea eugenioides]
MEARRQQRGPPRGQAQNQKEESGSVANQNTEPRAGANDQVALAINHMTDLLERLVPQQGQGAGQVNQQRDQEIGEDKALERFQKFSPSKFSGSPGPEIAENWLENMINIFVALKYIEERQVTFVVFQFEEAARSWWNVVRTKWEREQVPWTWLNFTREFNEKYIPPFVQERREDEFIRLRQGSRSVAEYEYQFTKLSKFTPELVATEQKRKRRFIQGLNLEIQESLAALKFLHSMTPLKKLKGLKVQNPNCELFKHGKGMHLAVVTWKYLEKMYHLPKLGEELEKYNFHFHPHPRRGNQ